MRRYIIPLLVICLFVASNLVVYAGYPDPGTGKTNIFMQNLGTQPASVNLEFTTGDTGGQAWTTDTGSEIPPKASRYVLYSNFGVNDGWAGAVEVSATEPLAAIVNMFWDKPGLATAATYTGVDAPGYGVYLPLLALRPDLQISRMTVQNTEGSEAHITISFYDRDGNAAGTKTDTIPAKSEKTYSMDTLAPNFSATKGMGSAYISSDTKIAAIASQHWTDASEAGSGFTTGDTTLWIPGVFRKNFGGDLWNYNATQIQNLDDQPANIHVQFIKLDNTVTYEFDDVVAPKSTKAYNTLLQGTQDLDMFNAMTAALGTYWQGTMKVVSTNGKHLAGLSIMFPYSQPGLRDSLSFNAIRDSDATDTGLSFPAVYRKRTGGTDAQWSTSLIQNITNTAGQVEVRFFRAADGTEIAGGPWTVNIPANGSVRLNLKDGLELPQSALTALGTYFSGAMLVTPKTSGMRIIGVTNIYWDGTNRSSGYDGFPVPTN